MGLFSFFKRKPPSLLDALEANPAYKDTKALNDLMVLQCEMGNGVDADEVPNGSGEFGLAPTNPIPCKTIFGSTADSWGGSELQTAPRSLTSAMAQ